MQNTEPATRYRLEGDNLKAGWYVIEAWAKDKNRKEVKSLRYRELYDSRSGRPATPQYNWAVDVRAAVEPGEKAGVDVGSSAGNLFVIRKVERDGGAREDKTGGKFSYLTLDKEKKKVEFPVTEVDRGGFGVSDVFIKDDRLYTNEHIVQVPWTNKELTIQYASFRDKTLPGSEEKWQGKIAGYKTDKVGGEVLGRMYDARLDQFKMHTWSRPDPYPVYAPRGTWSSGNNFSFVQSQVKYINEPIGRMYLKSYDGILSVSAGKQIIPRGNPIPFNPPPPQHIPLTSGPQI